VYVDDVVAAFELALDNPDTFGKSFDLCGPKVYTFREIIELTARMIERKRLIIDLPDKLARLQAQVFEKVPGQPFTMDNYHSLQRDSVCSENGLVQLGIEPCSVESIMPDHFAGKDVKALRYSKMRGSGRPG
jgi:NADH dehydrogenase